MANEIKDTDRVKAPKDLAKALNRDEKSVRSALRKMTAEQPGSGGRWDVSSKTVGEWREIFAKRSARNVVKAELI